MTRPTIHELVMRLSSAIWRRPRLDATFSITRHMLDARGYSPKTPEELACWEELTHPDRYEELVEFVNERRRIPANAYALFLDSLILQAATERRAAQRGNADRALANVIERS